MHSRSRPILFLLLLLLPVTGVRAETVALALSGGGARGFAHIGILEALEEAQIEPDLIVGCSMGAVVGGLYAAGYSAAELKNIALTTDWSDLFLDRPSRRNLFLAQKETTSRHIIALRFRGLAPDVPLALSNGQKLSDLFFDLTQRAPYQPWPSFDDLRIPFRAVATDLVSGQPKIFDSGDLAEALRASISMPLVFSPYRMDTLALVDGGVTENIPVEIAIQQGADFVIAIDLSTGFVPGQTTEVPWELADRVTTLMHVDRNRQSREMADVVVAPDIGRHGSTEFTGIDSLIRAGYESMQAQLPELRRKLASRTPRDGAVPFYSRARYRQFLGTVSDNALPPERYHFEGVTLLPDSHVARLPLGRDGLTRLAHLRRAYVDEGYTMAHATHLELRSDRTLDSRWQEGYIRSISVSGLKRHKPWTILREFPLRPGQVFELRRARRGVAQIYGSEYFDSVTLAVLPSDSGTDLTIRVVERSSPQLRFGAGYSSERKGRGFAEFLNDNALGLNARLSLFGKYGERDEELRARVIIDRLPIQMPFDRDLGLYTTTDFSVRWAREEYNTFDEDHDPTGFYFFERTGADLWIGRAFRRWGLMSAGAIYELVRTGTIPEPKSTRIGPAVRTIVDTKDRYPFPSRGIEVRALYEYMWRLELDDGAFNRVAGKVDGYLPLARRIVVRGLAEYGWNDRLLPVWGLFQLGGEESLLGLHVAERLGNSKLSFLGEVRYDLLSRWIADAYVSAMYTAGAVSMASDPFPHDHDYQHGVGISFALSTFLGPMKITAAELLRSQWSEEHMRIYINLGHEF